MKIPPIPVVIFKKYNGITVWVVFRDFLIVRMKNLCRFPMKLGNV